MIIQDSKITQSPLVTVQVYAYNKEKYIRECLDSVLNQKTNFEYEVLVSENPGTDKTREICLDYQKKYPEKIILVLREENMGFFYNYFAAERMSRGKYIARCDADDYWCDQYKLQKQADFLESNQDYGCCYSNARVYDDSLHYFLNKQSGKQWEGFKGELINEAIPQPTVMYRKDLVCQYLDEIKPEGRDWDMEDVPRNLWFAWNSKVAKLEGATAVYRVVMNSWSHQTNYERREIYHRSIRDIRLFFYHMYCPGETELETQINNDYCRRNIAMALENCKIKELFANFSAIERKEAKEYLLDIRLVFMFFVGKIKRFIRKIQSWWHTR